MARTAPSHAVHAQVAAVRAGLPSSVFDELLEQLGLTASELGSIIRVSQRTLQRRRKYGRFSPEESDRLVRIVTLTERAEQALGAAAASWLTSPNRWFAAETPVRFADTEAGGREVLQALGRLEHGVFL